MPNAVSTVKPTGRIGPPFKWPTDVYEFFSRRRGIFAFLAFMSAEHISINLTNKCFSLENGEWRLLKCQFPSVCKGQVVPATSIKHWKVTLQPIPRSSRRFICTMAVRGSIVSFSRPLGIGKTSERSGEVEYR